jgi:hypothetical protein
MNYLRPFEAGARADTLDLGFATFVLVTPPEPDVLQTFGEQVAPRVRARVAVARGPLGHCRAQAVLLV